MDELWQDVRYGFRKLLRSPLFAVVAVLTLSLGIGVNTAIYSVVEAVLLRPLSYDDPDRLVMVWTRMEGSSFAKAPVAPGDLYDYRREADLFEGFAASNNVGEDALTTGDGEPQQIRVASVTTNFFELLGVDIPVGRDFRAEDGIPFPEEVFDDPEAPIPSGVVILSHGLWQTRFGGDPSVLGRVVQLDAQPAEVIGILPPEFRLHLGPHSRMPLDIDAWEPLREDWASATRTNQFLRVIGRLKPGVTLEQARAQMEAITARQRERFAFHANMGIHARVENIRDDLVDHVRPALVLLFGAVGLVLLIACVNVANLLLVRAYARSGEMAVRRAMGAGGRRLLRQVLTESFVLAGLGGAAGIVLARWVLTLVELLRPADLPRAGDIALDPSALLFTAAITVLATVLSGMVPALAASGANPAAALRVRTGGGAGSADRTSRDVLMVAEVGLSLVLLVAGGLLLRSFVELQKVEPGFRAEDVLTYKISLPFFRYREDDRRIRFYRELTRRVESLPGVRAAGAGYPLPLGGRFWTGPYGWEGEDPSEWTRNEANYRVVTPGYFEALGIPLLKGRTFEERDWSEERNVIVIDRTMAEKVWPGEDPVGRTLGMDLFQGGRRMEVVGVVERVRHESLTADGRETVYFPQSVLARGQLVMAVRSSVDPGSLVAPIRREVAELDPAIPIYDVRLMTEYVERAGASTRFLMLLVSGFAGTALLLAAVGLYGVVSSATQRRSREIGVRMALGAERGRILGLVVGGGLRLALMGIAVGLLGAFLSARLLAGLLYGVSPTDPLTFTAAPLFLLGVALSASFIPAHRATRLDPMKTLRTE